MVIAREKEPRPWRPLIPPEQKTEHEGRATLVLDMNKTLVIAVTRNQRYDFECTIPGSNASMLILKRPHVDRFLRCMSEIFEVIAFTSCERTLADPILDKLDPKGDIFAYRLFTESCSLYPSFGHVKDLSMLGRGMERVMIVDDSFSKCVLNVDNWVPISPFYGQSDDRELLDLIPFLEKLSKMDDVKPALRAKRIEWNDCLPGPNKRIKIDKPS